MNPPQPPEPGILQNTKGGTVLKAHEGGREEEGNRWFKLEGPLSIDPLIL